MHKTSRFPDQRKQTIRDRLVAGRPVLSNELASEFAVSEDAIRRDLRALAGEGICQRVYGGALPLSPASAPLRDRMQGDPTEKMALARRALSLLAGGQTVFLDSSSTNLHLARLLPEDAGIRIVTNSVPIAAELLAKPRLETDVIGGRINAMVGGRVDPGAADALADYGIDLCFLGACSYAEIEGLAGFDRDDVVFKRALLRTARATAVMLTTAKLGTHAPYRICPPGAVGSYILSADAPPPLVEGLAAVGPAVLVAQAPGRNVPQ